MFRINRRTDYAVRVMVALAKRPAGARLSTKEIQDEMLTPRAFLQRIIADLSKAGLIITYPGPNGGLQLSRPADEINLRHVWEAIEGALLISDCVQSADSCPLYNGCPVHSRWGRMQNLILQELEGSSLSQLARDAAQLLSISLPTELSSNLRYTV